MCLLNSANPDIALTLANVLESLQELAVNPDSPYAFAHDATLDVEVPALARLVRENSQAKRDAAAYVAKRFAVKGLPLLPAIATVPVCPACHNARTVVIGIDPMDWTGGTELMGPCPACMPVVDDHDLRQFA